MQNKIVDVSLHSYIVMTPLMDVRLVVTLMGTGGDEEMVDL